MHRSLWRGLSLLLWILLLISVVSASTEVILIKSPGCHKCADAERTLDSVMSEDKDIRLTSYDYFSDDGHRVIRTYRTKDVPAIVIGKQVINYRDYNGDNQKLDKMIRAALANQSFSLNSSYNNSGTNISTLSPNQSSGNQSFYGSGEIDLGSMTLSTIFTVFAAGLLAGFNPCLLGILVFLAASVMSSSGRRRDLMMMIVSFSLGIFTMYFLFGLGMQHVLQARTAADGFRYVLTFFLVVLGLLHIEDARRLNKGGNSLFRTDWVMKYVEAGVNGKRLSSYFLIGALFSLVKAPCVGAVYLAILDVISARSYAEGAVYLVFYNLGIVLPIILLGGLIALGMSPEQVDKFRKDYRATIRLVTGLALLALAPLIYFQLI
ncbi:MAG: cytochrome c biogenesis CcdA family protein [Methanotrichaceae archaeon]|jgi:cytochrome c biogenesis protein CcdA